MADDVLSLLFEHKAWCNRAMVAAFRGAPDDADARGMARALYTFDHTVRVDQIFRARLSGEPAPVTSIVGERRPDIETLARLSSETDAWFVDYVGRTASADLDETVEFDFVGDGDAGRLTRGQILAHLIAHGASHRGAINRIFEEIGVRGGRDMVTTFCREAAAGSPSLQPFSVF